MAAKQADYSKYLKGNLKSGECLIHLDFAENYSFVVQDAVQSFYWTNSQSTIHPVCAYYLDESGNLTHKSFCIISDHLIHDTNAVHTFLAELIPQLRTLVGILTKIYYFSNGGPAHYKNKYNFANLSMHSADFDVEAEWHFFASCHGKGACDGIGGNVKRAAYRTSLQRPVDSQITTPFLLFEWAKESTLSKSVKAIAPTAIRLRFFVTLTHVKILVLLLNKHIFKLA